MQATTTASPAATAPARTEEASGPSPSIIPGAAALGKDPVQGNSVAPEDDTKAETMDAEQPAPLGKRTSKRKSEGVAPETPAPKEPEVAAAYKDPEHGPRLLQRLQEVLETDSASCDLTMIADDGSEARLHSLMARALAPGLEQVLPDLQGCVRLPGISGKVLPALVQYMYYGNLAIEEDTVSPMLSAASFLAVKGAQELCGRFLKSTLTAANVLSRYTVAQEHGLEDLLSSVLGYIDVEAEAVLASPGWVALEKQQVAEILSRETLRVKSEDEVLDALKRWSSTDSSGSEQQGSGERGSRQSDYEELVLDPTVIRIGCLGKERLAALVMEVKEAPCEALDKYLHSELLTRMMGGSSTPMRIWQRKGQSVGQPVLKDFGGVLYKGSVTEVELEEGTRKALVSIRYDDGDCEDLYEEEAEKVMAAAKAAGMTAGAVQASGSKRKSSSTPKGGSSKKKGKGKGK